MQRESFVDRATALKPIFVVGAPRSGTTLVGKILGQHSKIHTPGETHFFEDIWSRRQEMGELKTEAEIAVAAARTMTLFQRYNFPETQKFVDSCLNSTALVQQTLDLEGGYGALYAAFMMTLANCAGKTSVCDDTPKHLFYIPDILQLFPGARFIGCVRDPRDFLFSYRNYWRRSSESDRIKALYHPIVTSMIWRSSAKSLLKYARQLGPDKMLLVQYENLVQNPEQTIQDMSNFLALGFEPEMMQIESNNSSFEQTSTGIFATSVGRWRTGLPAEDAWWCQTINQNTMADFSLQKDQLAVSKKAVLSSFASTPSAFITALNANKEKRGPLLGYLVRRMRALIR